MSLKARIQWPRRESWFYDKRVRFFSLDQYEQAVEPSQCEVEMEM